MKKDPPEIIVSEYTYELPKNKIAQFPLSGRDKSKLLIYNKGNITEDIFFNIPTIIPDGSLLVFNNTKVINARLKFTSSEGKEIEIFTLEPAENTEIISALGAEGSAKWICLVGNLKAWKGGKLYKRCNSEGREYILEAELITRQHDANIIQFSWNPGNITLAEVIDIFGMIPLPPYMKRESINEDNINYQTIYADRKGSVAAPTAGLHFTPDVMDKLHKKGIDTEFITLHVGAGTFKPVNVPLIRDHVMHSESIYVSIGFVKKLIETLKAGGDSHKKIIAVGTTSMRTVESLYWLGVQIMQGRYKGGDMIIEQWEPYQYEEEDTIQSLNALSRYMSQNSMHHLYGKTNIIIVPGYEFKLFNGLITNFHQPTSTLLLLIAAFIGNDWRRVYDYALNNDFRFLSYGDSSILFK